MAPSSAAAGRRALRMRRTQQPPPPPLERARGSLWPPQGRGGAERGGGCAAWEARGEARTARRRSPPEGGREAASQGLAAAPPVGPSMLRPSGDPGRGRLKARKPGAAVPLRDSGLSAAVWALATAAPSYPRLFSLPGCMPGRGCSQASFSPSLCRCSMAQVHPLQTKGLPKLFKKTAVAVNEACSGGSSGFCACNFLSRQAQQHLRHLLFLVTDCLVNWSETRSSIKGKEGQSII
ncbi:uncharacterized protein LOC119564413 isoform X2 [Chelonia mydas]|uniref:uncharacterized protein LOC119564413 isoform X2 n=1 Tax=Chelonia mydas TaxID=8469 RepID=UPI001CA88C70|nr:uncharacterized protein LOC119564413 isoform X2 [Chelonia mydas]